jgi:cellulose synthase (UDP-forming)
LGARDGGVAWCTLYRPRGAHTHAKAGNINHALAQLDLDVVGILDADHIADSGFLTNTLGYFEDP